jgi:hypothetical protein
MAVPVLKSNCNLNLKARNTAAAFNFNNLNVTVLKGLNISLVKWIHYSTPPGLPEGFLYLPWVAPTVIKIISLRD